VQPETPGEVIFNGSSRVEIDSDEVNFTGFQFIGGDIVDPENFGRLHVVRINGSNVLFENVNISEYTCYKYLIVQDSSQFTTIKNCNFEHRINNPDQNILSILVNENQAGFHVVQYCSFKNFDGEPSDTGSVGDAGVEPIRIGVSTTAEYASKSIVEYCYFTQCNGDGEIISHKAAECVYRYNTFDDNPEGRSLNLNASSADGLDNILIAYNTFVNTDVIDIENHSTNEATNVTIANNIFANPSSGDGLFEDLTDTETWIGNVAFGDLGEATSTDFTIVDPQLSLNSEGYYEIASTSPVINKGETGYPALPVLTDLAYDNEILLDILTSARPTTEAMKDLGCQEYNASVVLAPHVTEENTGPDYFIDPSILSTSNEELITKNFSLYPNPLVNNIINLNFYIEQESNVKVDVYDLSGKKLLSLIDASYGVGNQNFNSTLNLGSGLYLLYIEVSSGATIASKIEKIIKQ